MISRIKFSRKVGGWLIYGIGGVLLISWGGYARLLKPEFVPPAHVKWDLGGTLSGKSLVARGGGLTTVAADFAWIRAMMAWERESEAETVRGIYAAVALNPRSPSFWVNGARILAFDIASWRVQRLEASISKIPRAAKTKIMEEQARLALAFLARGEEILGQSAVLAIESGWIHWHARKDRWAASACFRRAMEAGNVPDYVKTLLAELTHQPSQVQTTPRADG